MRRILLTVMFALVTSTIWFSFQKNKKSESFAPGTAAHSATKDSKAQLQVEEPTGATQSAELGEQDSNATPASSSTDALSSSARNPATSTGDPSPGGRPDKIEQWLKQRDAHAQWNVSRSTSGEVIAISGGTLAKPSSDGDIRHFAEELANQLGIPTSQLDSKTLKLEGTFLSEPTVINQKFLDYEVYGGFLKLMQNRKTGEMYYAMNSLAQVGEPSLEQTITDQKAIELIKSHHQQTQESADEIFLGHAKPFLFVKEPKKSELAWSIYSRKKAFITEYLVSAKNGEILSTIQRWNE